MKTNGYALILALAFSASPLLAQSTARAARPQAPARQSGPSATTNSTGDYASDVVVVRDSQQQALEQAQQMLESGEGVRDRSALETAIKQMKLAQGALDDAKKSPDKLPVAIAAEQTAYQALLKVMPREYRMTRGQRGGAQNQQNGQAGQASRRQMDQLDMPREENRYETESQALRPQNAQQREQSQTVDRLKELSQRQQDLNERLRELQNALQAANTDPQREEIQRQLKRLEDEQRQMLANVDELRQQLEQSPNASSQPDTQQQLEQTRNNMERAAQEMQNQSASGALAAGTRAQETMQNLRDNLRKQTSSQFSDQMRQLRDEARDLAQQQDEIARALDALNHGDKQALDNTAERKQVVQQLAQQQSTLTNLLSQMRTVTEQAEATEPLLSQQLYDTLRRADQMRTESILQTDSQLTDRGFLPQASEVERVAHTNVTELAHRVEQAAESVLGSEADALRYAQRELDDLTRQMEREIGQADTNAAGNGGTNSMAGARGQPSARESQLAGGNTRGAQSQERAQSPGREGNPGEENSTPGSPSGRGQEQRPSSANRGGSDAEQASAGNPPDGQEPGQGQGQNQARGGNARQGGRRGGNQQSNGGPRGGQRGGGNAAGDNPLRNLAVQLGRGGEPGGPITGNNYVNWSDRLRDVEQVLDPADLRNQVATVRERASVLRSDYRLRGQRPPAEVVREQILTPLSQIRVWVQEELARKEKSDSLVPLDRDPVPENYAEMVRKYYEKLGSAQ